MPKDLSFTPTYWQKSDSGQWVPSPAASFYGSAYSGPNRPHFPIQIHQSFRFKPATYSGWIKSTHSVSNRASDSGLNPPLWAGC